VARQSCGYAAVKAHPNDCTVRILLLMSTVVPITEFQTMTLAVELPVTAGANSRSASPAPPANNFILHGRWSDFYRCYTSCSLSGSRHISCRCPGGSGPPGDVYLDAPASCTWGDARHDLQCIPSFAPVGVRAGHSKAAAPRKPRGTIGRIRSTL